LEKPYGEIKRGVDQALEIVDEDLNSIGLEGLKAHPV